MALHICDNKCREESFRFFQLVAIVTEAGRAAHTLNLCKQCWNERWQKQGEQPVKAARCRELMEQQAFRGILRVAFWRGAINIHGECGSTSPSKAHGPKQSWRMRKKKGRNVFNAIGKRSCHSRRSKNQPSVAVMSEQESNRVRPEQP